MISAIQEELIITDKKREELGYQCIYRRKVFMMVSQGLTLNNLERACYEECGHHECNYVSLNSYLIKNHFR